MRAVAVDAVLHRHHQLELVAAHLLRLGAEVEEAHVDAAFAQLGRAARRCTCCELEVAVGLQGDLVLLGALVGQLDLGTGALEVEACADLLGRLVDGIAQLDEVGFEHGIEAGHGGCRWLRGIQAHSASRSRRRMRTGMAQNGGMSSRIEVEEGVSLREMNSFGLPAVARRAGAHPQRGRRATRGRRPGHRAPAPSSCWAAAATSCSPAIPTAWC